MFYIKTLSLLVFVTCSQLCSAQSNEADNRYAFQQQFASQPSPSQPPQFGLRNGEPQLPQPPQFSFRPDQPQLLQYPQFSFQAAQPTQYQPQPAQFGPQATEARTAPQIENFAPDSPQAPQPPQSPHPPQVPVYPQTYSTSFYTPPAIPLAHPAVNPYALNSALLQYPYALNSAAAISGTYPAVYASNYQPGVATPLTPNQFPLGRSLVPALSAASVTQDPQAGPLNPPGELLA